MKSWDEVSKEMQSNGVPLSVMGYCKIAFDFANANIDHLLKEVANALDFEINKVSTINSKPDDLLVLSVTGRLSEQTFNALKNQMKIAFPDNKCIVTDNTFSISIALKWTSDLPTQEGWYWLRMPDSDFKSGAYFECVQVFVDEKPFYFSRAGEDGYVNCEDFSECEWYGPIEPPEYAGKEK